MTSIPFLPIDEPKKLAIELGNVVGVQINESDISTAHRLKDTAKSKNRMIVKFVRRDKRDELDGKRAKLVGKCAKNLPSIDVETGKSVPDTLAKSKIFIHESLTLYRKRLLGRVRLYRKDNNSKFVWTKYGKIFLRENDTSHAYRFLTHEEFEDFLDGRLNQEG